MDPARGDAPLAIEDYGLIGDCRTAALVGRDGSIDWLCLPRFDAAACFAALLGRAEHGRWLLAAQGDRVKHSRSYRGESLILETLFETPSGIAAVIDFMPPACAAPTVVRIVEGREGTVSMKMHLTLRFDYGSSVPWMVKTDDGHVAIAGPNLAVLRTPVVTRGEGFSTVAEFSVREGERIPFVLGHGPSHRAPPPAIDADAALADTEAFWRDWVSRCTYEGRWRKEVVRSLLTLKALTNSETGGLVAAPTTSLPERIGGRRNWDYRYCWIRDATLTLVAMMGAGYFDEAKAWRNWLHRSLAGTPEAMQIMYGIGGERRLTEWEVPWLPGHRGSAPVRIGNAASAQLQLDVWGEMANALHLARAGDLAPLESGWALQVKAMATLEKIWRDPDEGLWEVRGGRQNFTHSKVMAWVAFDRSIADAEAYGLPAPVKRWRATRDEIHRLVCEKAFDEKRNTFMQSFESAEPDAALLLIPQSGFLPVDDPRVAGTIACIERELMWDGFVLRYRSETVADGLPPGEGVFLACSFWLAGIYQRQGRMHEAQALVARLLTLRNDLGLLSEEYDPAARSHLGNFPQAFSHLALVETLVGLDAQQPLRDKMGT